MMSQRLSTPQGGREKSTGLTNVASALGMGISI